MEAVLTQSHAALFTFATVFFRVAAMLAVLPLFGERLVPMRVRLGAAVAFAVLLFGTGVVPLLTVPSPQGALVLLLTETATGLVMGVLARLLFMALQTLGAMAAQATSLAQIFAGQALDPLPAIGHVLTFGGLALLASQGFLVQVVQFGLAFYDLAPVGHLLSPGSLADWGITRIGHSFGLAFRLAAPFFLASLLYYLAMGAINRAMPQLMVALIGAPLVTFISIALLALTAPLILYFWHQEVMMFLLAPTGGAP